MIAFHLKISLKAYNLLLLYFIFISLEGNTSVLEILHLIEEKLKIILKLREAWQSCHLWKNQEFKLSCIYQRVWLFKCSNQSPCKGQLPSSEHSTVMTSLCISLRGRAVWLTDLMEVFVVFVLTHERLWSTRNLSANVNVWNILITLQRAHKHINIYKNKNME